MTWHDLDPEGMDIVPEDFESSTAREERISAEYHNLADQMTFRSRVAKLFAGVAIADVIITCPATFDKPLLCASGVLGTIAGTAGTLAYRSLSKSKRDVANEGPQPNQI